MNHAFENPARVTDSDSPVSIFSLALQEKLGPAFDHQQFRLQDTGATCPNGARDSSAIINHFNHCAIGIALATSENPNTDSCWFQAILPEVVRILTCQAQMIFEIGKQLEVKDDLLRNDLVLSLMFLSAGGNHEGCSFFLDKNKLILRRTCANMQKMLLMLLSGRIAEGLSQTIIPKLFPSVIPAVTAAWAFCILQEAGRLAHVHLSMEIVQEETSEGHTTGQTPRLLDSTNDFQGCDYEKLKTLINLVKENHPGDDRLRRLVSQFVPHLRLSVEEASDLKRRLSASSRFKLALDNFQRFPGRVTDLMMDLIGISHEGHKITVPESSFIVDIAERNGFPREEIEYLLAEVGRATAFRSRHTLSPGG